MKIRGPVVTLFAAAAVGIGMWFVNVSNEEPAAATPVAAPVTTTTTAKLPAVPVFPAKAKYFGEIPTAAGVITLDVSVDGPTATAYACDGKAVESWMRGSASNGAMSLASRDKSSRLEGRLRGDAVAGTLWIGQQRWDFTADVAQPGDD